MSKRQRAACSAGMRDASGSSRSLLVTFASLLRAVYRISDAISTLIDEGTFTARPDKIRFRSIDPASISLVDFQLGRDAFDTYNLDAPKSIGVNLEDLNKMLRRARPSDRLKISVDEQANRLIITLEGPNVTTFSIPLLDLALDETPEHPIPFTATITKALISQTIKWRSNGRVEIQETEREYLKSRTYLTRMYRKTRQTTLLEAGTRQKKIDST